MRKPEKGVYRSIYSGLWDDPDFQALPSMAQLVFLCIRTSRECNFPCIFPFYLNSLSDRLLLADEDKVAAGFKSLIEEGWVRYERPILWIVKGLRNDPAYSPGNENQARGISRYINGLKKYQIVKDFATFYEIPYSPNSTPTQGPPQDPSKDPPPGPYPTPGEQRNRTGKRKRKEDLKDLPVDNSTDGTALGGSLVATPRAPSTSLPGVEELGEAIKTMQDEGKIPKWRNNN